MFPTTGSCVMLAAEIIAVLSSKQPETMTTITLNNPFSAEPVFSAHCQSFVTVAGLADTAQAASRAWSELAPAEHASVAAEALNYFVQHRDEISAGITREMGKPSRGGRRGTGFHAWAGSANAPVCRAGCA